jgi:putative ABC transport system substrate-binding protein
VNRISNFELRISKFTGTRIRTKRIWIGYRSGTASNPVVRNHKSAILVTALLFALYSSAEAQQGNKIPKIGWLVLRSAEGAYASGMTMRALREFGYIEGKNISAEYRHGNNNLERVPVLAEELVRLNVDVIVAASINSAIAAKHATRTIPIVFVSTRDPVSVGLVESLARPGGNLTGFTTIAPALTGKRFELLKETIPGLARLAVLWNPKNPASAEDWRQSQLSARDLGLQLHSMDVTAAEKFDSAFAASIKTGCNGMAVTFDALINSSQKRIADLATKHRIPAVYPRGDFAENGGLMSYGPDQVEPYRRIAAMIDKILKGARPAEIPVEQPTKFELVINLKTAKQIGITIPQSVLYRADRVIR